MTMHGPLAHVISLQEVRFTVLTLMKVPLFIYFHSFAKLPLKLGHG